MFTTSRPPMVWVALFVVACLMGDWLGQTFTLLQDSGLILRPATGIYLAVLLLSDRRHWPWWVLVTFLLDLSSSLVVFKSELGISLSFSLGHVLQILLSAVLITRLCKLPFSLNGLRQVMALAFFGATLGPMLGATFSALALVLAQHSHEPLVSAWPLWWLADAGSTMIFTPLILALAELSDTWRMIRAWRWVEASLMLLVFWGVASLFLNDQFPFGFIVMLPVLWAALRFEIAGSAVAMFVLTPLLLYFTASGSGMFVKFAFTPEARQGYAHFFLVVIAFSGLVVAGLTRQRRETLLNLEKLHRNLEGRFATRTAQLRESEARFRAIADYTYDWESWIGSDGKPLWINPAVQRFTGYTVGECALLKDYPLPLIHPGDRKRMADLFGDALKGRTENDIEFRITHRDGSEFWCAASWQPMLDSGGNAQGYRCSVRDIRERKRLEDELRESEEAFRAMFTVSSVGKVEADALSGRFLRVNAAFCRMTGYSEAELLERTFAEITHPNDVAADLELRAQVVRGERPYFEREKRYLKPDGAVIWAQVTLNPMRDKDGHVRRMTGVIQDITQRKHTERALLQSQRDLARAQEVGQIGSWRFEISTETMNLSDECYRIFGLSKDVTVGYKSLQALAHPDDRELVSSSWQQLITEQAACELEHRILVGGQQKWVRVKAFPELDENGRLQAAFGITQDITELKRSMLEIQYLASHDTLTKLPNRRLLLDRLQQGIAMVQRDARKLAVLYLDLDKFKPVNDAFGHAFGDQLLIAVAERLKAGLRRQSDTLTRIGGDEFVVLLPNMNCREDVETMAEEIIRNLCTPFTLENHAVSIGVSIGISVFPEHGTNAEELIDRADHALYFSKESGRNRYSFFSPMPESLAV